MGLFFVFLATVRTLTNHVQRLFLSVWFKIRQCHFCTLIFGLAGCERFSLDSISSKEYLICAVFEIIRRQFSSICHRKIYIIQTSIMTMFTNIGKYFLTNEECSFDGWHHSWGGVLHHHGHPCIGYAEQKD